MKFFQVSNEYIDYLWKIDNRVQKNSGDRKYIGIVFQINNFNYFAPLSSPKDNDYDENKKIKKNSTSLHRIVLNKGTSKEDFLGKIKFTSMIPVPSKDLIEIDINALNTNTIEEQQYKNLLNKQLYYIIGKKEKFLKDAEIVYFDKINENSSKFYYNFTVDFKLLEKAIQERDKSI